MHLYIYIYIISRAFRRAGRSSTVRRQRERTHSGLRLLEEPSGSAVELLIIASIVIIVMHSGLRLPEEPFKQLTVMLRCCYYYHDYHYHPYDYQYIYIYRERERER